MSLQLKLPSCIKQYYQKKEETSTVSRKILPKELCIRENEKSLFKKAYKEKWNIIKPSNSLCPYFILYNKIFIDICVIGMDHDINYELH